CLPHPLRQAVPVPAPVRGRSILACRAPDGATREVADMSLVPGRSPASVTLPPRLAARRKDRESAWRECGRPRHRETWCPTEKADEASRGECRSVQTAQGHSPAEGSEGAGTAPWESVPALELLVHGVGGTTPEKLLGDPRTVR